MMISLLQGAVLDQQGGNGTSGLIQTGLDDGALAPAVGVGLQVLDLGGEDHHFQQVIQAQAGLGGNGADDGVAAPLLGDQVVLGQLLLDLVRVGGGLIHLVHCHDELDICSLGVVDGLNGLGHDAVVGSHHQNGDIGAHRAAGTHRGKGGVARGIQEGDGIAVHIHGISADVLGNAAGLTGGDGSLPDGIQQRGLAVVNVAHDNHNGSAGLQLVGGVHMIVNDLLLDGDGDFLLHLAAHFRSHKLGGIEVDSLVDGGHDAVLHQQLDDLTGGLLHPGSQLAHGDLLGDLHCQLGLPGNLHLQAAQLLLLLIAGLIAPELVVLLVLLLALLAADALLAALVVLDPLGDQRIHPVVKTGGVHLHGRGIHNAALPLPLRLLGFFGLGALGALGALGSSGLLGLFGLGGFRLLRLGRFCLLRLGRLGLDFLLGLFLGLLGGEDLLQRIDLVGLGHNLEYRIQLLVRQNLGVGLGSFIKLGDDIPDFLRRYAEIGCNFLQTILHKTHI